MSAGVAETTAAVAACYDAAGAALDVHVAGCEVCLRGPGCQVGVGLLAVESRAFGELMSADPARAEALQRLAV